ncbi:Detected protein of unknown function [Hibiscus syriacus]|uniref:Uncharacterized protein n=1 Tax=Hibiscus syriacus TaxID=106335 RepID=A0A6A2XRS3_HIBSY|nr:Detected protein of unknown function [Hibiscus syriacus]
MSETDLTVLDGTHLRSLSPSLPDLNGTVTGSQLLEIADSKASSSLFGLSLPQKIKASALSRFITGAVDDDVTFWKAELDRDKASKFLPDYISAIADEMRDDPLVVSILDGNTLKMFLEDEDDYAMLAENLFTDRISKIKGRFAERDKKCTCSYGRRNGDSSIFRICSAQRHLEKVVNGSELRKVLADEKRFNDVAERVLLEIGSEKDGLRKTKLIRNFLEKHGKDFGLHHWNPMKLVLLYAVFSYNGMRRVLHERTTN